MQLIPFYIFRLFFFFKKIQINYKEITKSGVKRGEIISENMSALGNFHNPDLQVPKHPRTRLSIPSLLPEIPTALSQLSSPPGTPQRQRASAPTRRRPLEHRVYQPSASQPRVRIPKEWKTSLSATSKGNKGLKQRLKGQWCLHKKDHEHKPSLYQY